MEFCTVARWKNGEIVEEKADAIARVPEGLDLRDAAALPRVRAFVSHPDGKRLHDLAEAVARGELRIPIGNRLPISEVRAAHRMAERGAGGKILLIV